MSEWIYTLKTPRWISPRLMSKFTVCWKDSIVQVQRKPLQICKPREVLTSAPDCVSKNSASLRLTAERAN
ncbi:hypothetical protein ATANTOWER_014903 [Ataeniobius toweri]|uniref:Uncharacterized protein n=1 Tax=Ataeniobius toweri TaxID=208326 RepID=A0ABU7CGQ7_9TELE|nr:hypothetical protein [Ataeniobius toweri]